MDLQTFDVSVAKEHGLECAVLFQAIGYWAKHNRNKPDRQRDGKAWMYMSRREWLEEFGYIGEGTLRSSLQKLAAAGLIETGNYSEGMYARTTWYTLTDAGWELWLKQPKGSAETAKGFGENSQTITDTNITTTNSTGVPPVFPKPTKASRRANPGIRLEEFLSNCGFVAPEWGEWARTQLGWNKNRIASEWDDFHDYWTSGNAVHGGRKADWAATWRSHCRRSANRGGGRANGGSPDRGLATAVRAVVALRHGALQADGSIDTGSAPAGSTDADRGGRSTAIAPGEIPF